LYFIASEGELAEPLPCRSCIGHNALLSLNASKPVDLKTIKGLSALLDLLALFFWHIRKVLGEAIASLRNIC